MIGVTEWLSGLYFFFSSRRRHTRLVSDWSSDVCSSFSSRRRHTRLVSDWSSDVCSSDLSKTFSIPTGRVFSSGVIGRESLRARTGPCAFFLPAASHRQGPQLQRPDRKSVV